MTTDIHCHFIPRAFLNFLLRDPASGVRLVREQGERIDMTVGTRAFGLNPIFFEVGTSAAPHGRTWYRAHDSFACDAAGELPKPRRCARDAAMLCNDGLAEVVRGNSARFGAWAFLPMQEPEMAAAELQRCVSEHGFVGGHIASNVNGVLSRTGAFPASL